MAEPMSDERLAGIEKYAEEGEPQGTPQLVLSYRRDVLDLVAEVRRLRSTVDVLWATMNRDIKALADDALEDAGLPPVEGGYRA